MAIKLNVAQLELTDLEAKQAKPPEGGLLRLLWHEKVALAVKHDVREGHSLHTENIIHYAMDIKTCRKIQPKKNTAKDGSKHVIVFIMIMTTFKLHIQSLAIEHVKDFHNLSTHQSN